MAVNGKIYANTSATALSVKLINAEKESRLLDAKSGEQAVKILSEFGFGDGVTVTNPFEFEKLCEAEEAAIYRLIGELVPSENVAKAMKAVYDFHNLKSVFKAKYGAKIPVADMTYKFTDMDPEALKELVFADSYKDFTPCAREYAEKIDVLHGNGALTPAAIDFFCDEAMYKEIFSYLKKSNENRISEYYKTKIDLTNINVSGRAKKFGESAKTLSDMLLSNGYIDKKVFLEYLENSSDVLVDRLKFTKYKEIAKLMTDEEAGAWTKFEVASDNILMGIFKSVKYLPPEGLDPFFAYILARQTAVKNVRIIMVAINNGIDKAEIRERLRETYG